MAAHHEPKATDVSLQFELRANPNPRSESERAAILADPGFGMYFTDHMAVATWTAADGWHDSAIVPYGPFSLDPATAVLHYAQEIFEGLKAYRHADGTIWMFRPDRTPSGSPARPAGSRLPALAPEDFLGSIDALVAADVAWVPTSARAEPLPAPVHVRLGGISRRTAREAGDLLLHRQPGWAPTSPPACSRSAIWISTSYSRAAPGGTGAAKCGGNYAASLIAQQEAAATAATR